MTSRPAVQFKINFGLPTNLSHTPPVRSVADMSQAAAIIQRLLSHTVLLGLAQYYLAMSRSGLPRRHRPQRTHQLLQVRRPGKLDEVVVEFLGTILAQPLPGVHGELGCHLGGRQRVLNTFPIYPNLLRRWLASLVSTSTMHGAWLGKTSSQRRSASTVTFTIKSWRRASMASASEKSSGPKPRPLPPSRAEANV